MAKSTIFILASALCFLSFLGSAYGQDRFYVEGSVYCDTCRVQFMTKLSEPMPGATVRLECTDTAGSNNVTLIQEAVTDSNGNYNITVEGDHAEEVCQVVLVQSSREDCRGMDEQNFLEQASKISITSDNGIVAPYRSANPLGFLKKDPLPQCHEVLKELGMLDDGTLDLDQVHL